MYEAISYTTQGDFMPMFLYAFWAPIHENLPLQVMILAVAILVILDFATGMLGAAINKNWDSRKVREGLAHKCGEFGFIIVGDVIDALLFAGVDLPFDIPNGCALGFISLSIILMELSSIMENMVKIHPQLADNSFFSILKNVKVIKLEEKSGEHAKKEEVPED